MYAATAYDRRLGSESNRKIVSFRFVLACGRARGLVAYGNLRPEALAFFSLFPSFPPSFLFSLPPTPQASYPTSFGLIATTCYDLLNSVWYHIPHSAYSIVSGYL